MRALQRLRKSKLVNHIYWHYAHPVWWRYGRVRASVYGALGVKTICARWSGGSSGSSNWGDALNPFLIRAISGLKVEFTDDPCRLKYLVVGSIMNLVDDNTVVWGAGCIEPTTTIRSKPMRVCAVRGPLTREILMAHGIDAPAIYGDPALLMPRFYDPDVETRYDVGVIPHEVERGNPWVKQYEEDDRVCIIDVYGDRLQFVRNVKQCRHIISSSLHGIICADAYGIPATWVELSDGVRGDGFKFRDYFASIRRTDYEKIRVDSRATVWSLVKEHVPYSVSIDLDALYDACPFRGDR